MITIKKDNRWISIGGHKQKVSDLPPELKSRFIKMGLLEDDTKVEVEKEIRIVRVPKVREYDNPKIEKRVRVERKRYVQRVPDNGLDVVMRVIGRSLGLLWKRLNEKDR